MTRWERDRDSQRFVRAADTLSGHGVHRLARDGSFQQACPPGPTPSGLGAKCAWKRHGVAFPAEGASSRPDPIARWERDRDSQRFVRAADARSGHGGRRLARALRRAQGAPSLSRGDGSCPQRVAPARRAHVPAHRAKWPRRSKQIIVERFRGSNAIALGIRD